MTLRANHLTICATLRNRKIPVASTSLATVWLMMLRLFEREGLAPDALIAGLGITREQLAEPGARVPSRLADVIFARAAAQIPDPAFALHAARCWHPSNLGILGYAWLSSSSLHTALKRLERYNRVLGERFHYRVHESADTLRFEYDHGRGEASVGPYMTDFSLSIILDMCRTNFGEQLQPLEVSVRRERPADTSAWDTHYGVPVNFGMPMASFVLSRADADRRLPSGNRAMAATFDTILAGQLAELVSDNLLTRCKAHLLEHLTSGEPSEGELAAALGLSRRTLQRKLAAFGLSYKRLVDEVREQLARRYLDDPQRSLTEITFLLGFSEQSAFTRAFRRWNGESPSTYRQRRQQAIT